MEKMRLDHELPQAIEWGWRFHHLGVPTKKERNGERYLEEFGLYVSGFSTSPFGIEWMRFEKNSSIHPLIQSVPHLAFEVDDIEYELSLRKFKILTPLNSPSKGTKVVMIEHNGAPVELIEFEE
ncbi:MAG: hypothetical protein JXR71_00030 [Bacteroidales bacterium]|nr:hypothetical protein [Bacteroidales bacterium]